MNYSATDCSTACNSGTPVTVYSKCSTLTTGCTLYSDTSETLAPLGYYSMGGNCYSFSGAKFGITSVTSCPVVSYSSNITSVSSFDASTACSTTRDTLVYSAEVPGSATRFFTDASLGSPFVGDGNWYAWQDTGGRSVFKGGRSVFNSTIDGGGYVTNPVAICP